MHQVTKGLRSTMPCVLATLAALLMVHEVTAGTYIGATLGCAMQERVMSNNGAQKIIELLAPAILPRKCTSYKPRSIHVASITVPNASTHCSGMYPPFSLRAMHFLDKL